jgi:nitrite reductase/ring-hydroxylating ferredoxin subunit
MHSKALPMWPDTWYVVACSEDLSIGKILPVKIAEHELVVYRTESGKVYATHAYCPHMGAHLTTAKVQGVRLQCGLHNWTIDDKGCMHDENSCLPLSARMYQTGERFGLVFVFAGDIKPPALPQLSDDIAWITGKPILLDADWFALMINGFDTLHMRTVHQRSLIAEPVIHQAENVLHFNYETEILGGGGWSSFFMKWLSDNRVIVRQSCYGTAILVESIVGKIRSYGFFSFLQNGNIVKVFCSFGLPQKGWLWPLRLRMARMLYLAFLSKDYHVVSKMKLDLTNNRDPGALALKAFLESLPSLSHQSR